MTHNINIDHLCNVFPRTLKYNSQLVSPFLRGPCVWEALSWNEPESSMVQQTLHEFPIWRDITNFCFSPNVLVQFEPSSLPDSTMSYRTSPSSISVFCHKDLTLSPHLHPEEVIVSPSLKLVYYFEDSSSPGHPYLWIRCCLTQWQNGQILMPLIWIW